MSEDISTITEWCRQAREILGSKKTARAKLAVSGEELPDDDTLTLIARLDNFSNLGEQVKAYRVRHAELTGQLKAAESGPDKNRLGLELRALNQDVQASLVEAPKRNAPARWLKDLEYLLTLAPRDGLLYVKRILGEIESFRGGDDTAWTQQLDDFQKQAEQARQAVVKRAGELKSAELAECVSLRTETEKGPLAGGDLLKVIDELHSRMSALKIECKACGLETSDIEATVAVEGLEKRYEAGFPQRTKNATASKKPVIEGEAPVLASEEDTLKFLIAPPINKNWFTLKKLFKEGDVSEEQMKQAWALRQKIVDDYMRNPVTETYKLKKGVTWMAPGSTNLESDIDVTILDHHWSDGPRETANILKTDAAIVKEFNDWFLGKYGAQPGIMFDVNLYASAKPRRPLPPLDKQSPVEKAMTSMTNAGQDVGALMKMRRFMDWEEFDAYQQTVIEQMREDGASKEDIDTTRSQFETADGDFQMFIQAGLDKLVELLGPKEDRTDEQTRALELVNKAQIEAAKLPFLEGQKLLLKTAQEIEHMQDVAMWVNNELYTKGIEEVRQLELEVDELTRIVNAGSLGPDSAEARKMVGKVARLKQLATETVFYANEAYHSEGPFAHIVEATQAVKGSLTATLGTEPSSEQIAVETQKRQDALSVHLCLQSFNEQAGDMLKDISHYASEPNPGIGFYRASKYLARLMDALVLLENKGVKFGDLKPASKAQEIKSTLLAARKGEIKFEGIEPSNEELEVQAYAIEQMERILGVRTLGALGAWVKKTCAQVNANARILITQEMRAAKELEKAYFTA